jgi:hypothetical protein
MGGNLLERGGALTGLASGLDSLGMKAAKTGAGLATFAAKLGTVATALGGLGAYVGALVAAWQAGGALGEAVAGRDQDIAMRRQALMGSVDYAATRGLRKGGLQLLEHAQQLGLVSDGKLNQSKLMAHVGATSMGNKDFQAAKQQIEFVAGNEYFLRMAAFHDRTDRATAQAIKQGHAEGSTEWARLMLGAMPQMVQEMAAGPLGLFFGTSTAPMPDKKEKITVNIAKVEVPAKDPDRWIHDLGEFAARRVRAPSQPRAALRGGF